MDNYRHILPPFPKTPHIPRANLVIHPSDDDLVANDISPLANNNLVVEEKVDGANCGMALVDGYPVIRNRVNILKKGYSKRDTPAKIQFRPAWNWIYNNKEKFEKINGIFGYPVGIYGEWVLALHGIVYDKLPAYFITYDIYDPSMGIFLDPPTRREALSEAGFANVPLLRQGAVDLDTLAYLCQSQSKFGPDLVEGVYIKTWDKLDGPVTHRFKMIRDGYTQGCKWSKDEIKKQGLI